MGQLETFWAHAWQTEQYNSNLAPGGKSVIDALATKPAGAVTAQAVTQAEESSEQHVAFLAGHPQFLGNFVDNVHPGGSNS